MVVEVVVVGIGAVANVVVMVVEVVGVDAVPNVVVMVVEVVVVGIGAVANVVVNGSRSSRSSGRTSTSYSSSIIRILGLRVVKLERNRAKDCSSQF